MKKLAILIIFVLSLIALWSFTAEASPLRQSTLDVNYTNDLSPSFVAQQLELASDRVASVEVRPLGGGCTVTFNLPLRTDVNQTFDRQGNVITQRSREINQLTANQQDILDKLMRSQGCLRS